MASRVEIGIGAQHEDAVEPFILLDLIGVDREVILADRLQVASITAVADQRFVALGELPLQCGYDRSAIGGILRRLLMIPAYTSCSFTVRDDPCDCPHSVLR